MSPPEATYYRPDLAWVHHVGFGFHADACAPGILALLEPIRERGGLVLELGCGSGLLTRHLIDAGHRVMTVFSQPAADVFVHDITTFLRNDDGSWRRDDEHHENVLLDAALMPGLLAGRGVDVKVQSSFGGGRCRRGCG